MKSKYFWPVALVTLAVMIGVGACQAAQLRQQMRELDAITQYSTIKEARAMPSTALSEDFHSMFDESVSFMDSIPKNMIRGKEYEWECGNCGGVARGSRVVTNGHLHARCEQCGCGFDQ